MRLRDVQRRADRAAALFDTTEFLHGRVRDDLLERMRPIALDAAVVVDLGAATGAATRRLERRFRGACVVSLDLSRNMLKAARRKRRLFARDACVQADALALPFADRSVDVAFANLLLPFVDRPERLFAEVARVLRVGGLFAFSALGPDSLASLRDAWQAAGGDPHVQPFPDMHDLGDALLHAGLRDPVLDVDRLSVDYASPQALFRDLTAAGARNALAGRAPSLTGRQRFAAMTSVLETKRRDGKVRIDLELVFGHAFGAAAAADGYRIRAADIGRRRG